MTPTKFFSDRVSCAQACVLATGIEITRSARVTRLDTAIVPRGLREGTSSHSGESASREATLTSPEYRELSRSASWARFVEPSRVMNTQMFPCASRRV